MTTEEELLARLETDPGGETRLVYADWLDAHGQAEKAEFLRLEHQLQQGHARFAALRPRMDRAWVEQVLAHRADKRPPPELSFGPDPLTSFIRAASERWAIPLDELDELFFAQLERRYDPAQDESGYLDRYGMLERDLEEEDSEDDEERRPVPPGDQAVSDHVMSLLRDLIAQGKIALVDAEDGSPWEADSLVREGDRVQIWHPR
jgi:uncharacterized protein (TIGR02996 family)